MRTAVRLGYHGRSPRTVGLRWRKDKYVMSPQRIANYGAAGDPIFGRERELAKLEGLVDELSEHGAALLVRGEPGIGKSTLLAAVSQRAEAAGGRGFPTNRGQAAGPPPFSR